MKYGRFDDERKEYVITNPKTPLPWINYIGINSYFGLISNTAGGYSFYKDARYRRITRYRYNNQPSDVGGRYIYLRDQDSSLIWSPTWQPVQTDLDQYICRHGLGYTIIEAEKAQIASKITYFVPLQDNLEIWKLEIHNKRQTEANLSAFSFVEFCLWNAVTDFENFQRNLNTGEVEIDKKNGIIFHKTEYRERRNHFAYFACSDPITGYDTQRSAFIGTYRGFHNPQVVENGQSQNSHAFGWSPIGSHHVSISLNPGEKRTILFLLGYHENPVDKKFDPPNSTFINREIVDQVILKYKDITLVNQAFDVLKKTILSKIETFQVDTPDIHTNRMVNVWNAYQCLVNFNLSRSASFFESGISRGIGFRDSNQDLLAFCQFDPERARTRILDLAATQLQTGGAYHQYQPLDKLGNNEIGSEFNDDPLWLVLSTIQYIKETGDNPILTTDVPFDNNPDLKAPLLEHLHRCFSYYNEKTGPHGLPLIGRADWNDCLNLNCFSKNPDETFQTARNKHGEVAESVFIAGLYVLAAREFAQLLKYLGDKREAITMQNKANRMEEKILNHGWDGKWFLRAYDAFSHPIGSNQCAEGQIFIEPQGICSMADIGLKDGRVTKALNAVHQRLATPHGIMLIQPPYTQYKLHLGEISSYPPGYKENGSIFCHTNPWIMIAETKNRNGDRAYDYYLRINPSFREDLSEVHKCEPYVYAQMIAGQDAPTFGEAKNSWLTGTASWNYIAITQWILGIRPSFNGLIIDPVIPQTWKRFKVTRLFRGKKYDITFQRSTNYDSQKIIVNGKKIEGNFIPLDLETSDNIQVLVFIRSPEKDKPDII